MRLAKHRALGALVAVGALAGSIPASASAPADYMQRVQQNYREAMASHDANGDGRVTRDEAQGSVLLQGRFGDIDTDRDGTITRAELERFLSDMPPDAL